MTEAGPVGRTVDVDGHTAGGAPDTCTDAGCVEAGARGDRWIGPHCSVEDDGRTHFHHVDALHANAKARRDADFADLCRQLDAEPGDFPTAWHYLQNHPIFHRPELPADLRRFVDELNDSELEEVRNTDVIDADGLRDMWVAVQRDDDGGTVVTLEHGPHLHVEDVNLAQWTRFPAEGQASHDPRLDSTAATCEQAIVMLAAKVRATYGDDRARVPQWWATDG